MCGIIGGNMFPKQEQVIKGLTSMMHRGTDGNVIFSFDKKEMYLSHNRLSIQDTSQLANQPLISSDGRYYLSFNGELWKSSFEKYWKKLNKEYKFKTKKSDSELLLYYLIKNIKKLKQKLPKLDGMFCFALYDKVEDTTYLGRDFIGRLPFYYIYENGLFSFASEAKGLVDSLEGSYYKIDVKNPKYVPISEWRIKESIHPVMPGTLIKFSPSAVEEGSYIKKEIRWWDFKPSNYDKKNKNYPALYTRTKEEFEDFEADDKGLKYYVEGFREKLIKAVDNETISDVPICTILSGGIDSTVITHILKNELGMDVEAFVVNVNPTRKSKYKDDLYYARLAAKQFNIKLHEVNVDRIDIEDLLLDSVWASETYKWTQVSPAVAQLFLAWEIRDKGYKVVFGGEGADEIFASYGDVKRFCWNQPIYWHQKRINLLNGLHKSNLVRTNKAMMYGGKVELRTPFLNKEVVDFGLRIPTRYRDENWNDRSTDNIDVFDTKVADGKDMKFILRKAFEKDIPNELLWRPKKTFQVGCHTDYLKKEQKSLDDIFEKLFINRTSRPKSKNIGHIGARATIVNV